MEYLKECELDQWIRETKHQLELMDEAPSTLYRISEIHPKKIKKLRKRKPIAVETK